MGEQSQIIDLRERCPMCNKLTPEHTRWCGGFLAGAIVDEVEEDRSLVHQIEEPKDKLEGFF